MAFGSRVNSRGYSDEELQKQAAGVAYAWKKVNAFRRH